METRGQVARVLFGHVCAQPLFALSWTETRVLTLIGRKQTFSFFFFFHAVIFVGEALKMGGGGGGGGGDVWTGPR